MALVALQIHLHLKCYATGNKSSLHQELRNSGKFRVDAIKHREGFARKPGVGRSPCSHVTGCLVSGKSLQVSEPQLPSLTNESDDNCLLELLIKWYKTCPVPNK